MGVSDREYVREGRAAFHLRGRVVLWLIGATVAMYVVQGVLLGRGGQDLSTILGVVPERLTHGWIWQLVTHPFLHDPYGIWHILGNMFFLYLLGSDVAEVYGPRRSLALYFLSAAACALAYTASAYAVGRPDAPAIGASGAVFGVAVVAAHVYPTRPVPILWFFSVPLWFLLTVYVSLDVYYVVSGVRPWLSSAGHLGGALFGAAYWYLRLYEVGGRPPRPPARETSRLGFHKEVDRILAKISREGMDSLTQLERETLGRASK